MNDANALRKLYFTREREVPFRPDGRSACQIHTISIELRRSLHNGFTKIRSALRSFTLVLHSPGRYTVSCERISLGKQRLPLSTLPPIGLDKETMNTESIGNT